MAKGKVWISYDYDIDKHYMNLLLKWEANSQFDFSLYDQSVDVPADSSDAAAIKRVISARIKASTYFLCIVGKYTHISDWSAWEIEKAIQLKKRIVAVKTDHSNTTPDCLNDVAASWALSFTLDSIENAIHNA